MHTQPIIARTGGFLQSLQVRPEHIPAELRNIPQWVCWDVDASKNGNKPHKLPINPHTGRLASIDDHTTWATFDEAFAACKQHGYAGLWLALTEELGLVAIDIDNCISDDQHVPDWVDAIIHELDSYTEISPSGRGIRIVAYGVLPGNRNRTTFNGATVEVYSTKRFISFTGHHIEGTPNTIESRQQEIEWFYSLMFPQQENPEPPQTHAPVNLTDAELIEKAMHAENGGKFKQLWDGDWSGYPSQSEADLALLSMLLFWCGGDEERAARLFSQSALGQREKWRDRPDYRQATMQAALNGKTEFYSPKRNGTKPGRNGESTQSHVDEQDGVMVGDILHYKFAAGFFNDNFRRITGSKTWLRWDGKRWRITDDDSVVSAVMQHLSVLYAERFTEATKRGSKEAEDWLKLLQEASRTSRMKGVVEYAGGLPELQVSRSDLDRDPWLLNLLNGTLDLRTMTLREHRREDLITKLAPVHYDPSATSTAWEEHLNLCLPNVHVRRHLQRSLGKAVVGAVLDETLDLWYGADGANGKSTTARVVMKLLGDYARKAAPKLLVRSKHERHPTEIADLAGSRVVFSVEIDAGDQLNVALVKDLTGGDTLKARFLYENHFEFSRTFSLFLLVNHLPVVESADGGIWRRLRVVPWTVQIPVERRRPQDEVVQELTEGTNGSAVLNWMLAGLVDFMNDRNWVPQEVQMATIAYRYEQDPLLAFIEERCDLHPRYQVGYTALYNAYKEWCYLSGQEPVSQTMFTRGLLDRGIQKRRVGHEKMMVLFGVRLKPEQPHTPEPEGGNCSVDYAMRIDAGQVSIKSYNSNFYESLRKIDPHRSATRNENYNSSSLTVSEQHTPLHKPEQPRQPASTQAVTDGDRFENTVTSVAPQASYPVRDGLAHWCGTCGTATVHKAYKLIGGVLHWQCIECSAVHALPPVPEAQKPEAQKLEAQKPEPDIQRLRRLVIQNLDTDPANSHSANFIAGALGVGLDVIEMVLESMVSEGIVVRDRWGCYYLTTSITGEWG